MFACDPCHEPTYRKIIALQERQGDGAGALATYGELLDALETRGGGAAWEQAAVEAIARALD